MSSILVYRKQMGTKMNALVKLTFEFLVSFASIQYTQKWDLFLSTLVQ